MTYIDETLTLPIHGFRSSSEESEGNQVAVCDHLQNKNCLTILINVACMSCLQSSAIHCHTHLSFLERTPPENLADVGDAMTYLEPFRWCVI